MPEDWRRYYSHGANVDDVVCEPPDGHKGQTCRTLQRVATRQISDGIAE